MLDLDEIEPANAEPASPVMLIPMKDGSLRFCVKLRRLNAMTKRDTYWISRMDKYIYSLGDAKLFTALDCNQGYWKVELAPRKTEKKPPSHVITAYIISNEYRSA